jgi:hypothetical protein
MIFSKYLKALVDIKGRQRTEKERLVPVRKGPGSNIYLKGVVESESY